MRKMKIWSVFLVLCLITLLVAACSLGSSSRAVKANPKETVTKAYQKLSTLKSYHMTMDVLSSLEFQGKNMNTVIKGEMDIQQNPMLCKNTMNITTEIAAQKTEQVILQYIEESGDQFIVYSNINNQWVKQSMPKNGYNPLKDYDDYMKAITSVTLKSEDDNSYVFEVVASGTALQEQMQKRLSAMGMQNVNLTTDLFKGIGDLTYMISVDKKTENISKIEIDMSDFMAKIGNNIADSKDVPDDQKKMIKEMFSNMKVKTSVLISQYDSVGKITIPAEAKQQ